MVGMAKVLVKALAVKILMEGLKVLGLVSLSGDFT